MWFNPEPSGSSKGPDGPCRKGLFRTRGMLALCLPALHKGRRVLFLELSLLELIHSARAYSSELPDTAGSSIAR